MGMCCKELREISPKSFRNKLEGFAEADRKEWEKTVFLGVMAGNSGRYKKPYKQKDYEFLYRDLNIQIPTKEDTEEMDRVLGRKLKVI